ncbi:MAG: hypothetical protein IPF54_23265 [Draconibacterium sp.]|nr:hypothetical protein [Draconibacterium sp.]
MAKKVNVFLIAIRFLLAMAKRGDKAVLTDVKMEDISGVKVSIDEAKKENGILVLFSCNTCPFVMQWQDRFPDLKAWAIKQSRDDV